MAEKHIYAGAQASIGACIQAESKKSKVQELGEAIDSISSVIDRAEDLLARINHAPIADCNKGVTPDYALNWIMDEGADAIRSRCQQVNALLNEIERVLYG